MKKKNIAILGVGAAVIASALIATHKLNNNTLIEDIKPDKFVVTSLSKNKIKSSTIYTGSVKSTEEFKLQQDNSKGELKDIFVAVGDTVEVGTVLATYYNNQLESQMITARRNLEQTASKLNELEINGYEYDVTTTTDENGRDITTSNQAEKKKEYDTQFEILNNEYIKAQDEVNYLQGELDKLTATSTVSGTVVEINKNSNDKPLIYIVNETNIQVEGVLKQNELQSLYVGQKVKLTNKNDKENSWSGEVDYIANYPKENSDVTVYPYTIKITEGDVTKLKPGYSMEITVDDSEEYKTIPVDSVVQIGDDFYVYVYKDGKVKETKVELGRADGLYQEIKSGLSDEDKVVADFAFTLTDGEDIVVYEEKE